MFRSVILFACGFIFSVITSAGFGEPAARTILVLGDSISAGYGLNVEQGWVSLLRKRLLQEGYGYRLVNASVSGETTTGGLARLPRALGLNQPTIVIIELGGNDGLRGLPLATTRTNLDHLVTVSQQAHAKVLLLGMRMPPNYGPRYTEEFSRSYRELAARRKLAFVAFLLDGVALNPALMQPDGLHPNASGQPMLLDTIWAKLLPLLGKPTQLPEAAPTR